jgi:hypothetical protein
MIENYDYYFTWFFRMNVDKVKICFQFSGQDFLSGASYSLSELKTENPELKTRYICA